MFTLLLMHNYRNARQKQFLKKVGTFSHLLLHPAILLPVLHVKALLRKNLLATHEGVLCWTSSKECDYILLQVYNGMGTD